MNTNFENDPDYRFSKKMSPIFDDFYRYIYSAKRIVREHGTVPDKLWHVDTTITLPNKQILLFQEKCLRNEFYHWNTLTVEFYQNRHTNELGEFFKMASQLYFHAYSNETEDGFARYSIVNWPNFCAWINDTYTYSELLTKVKPDTRSNASFIAIDYDDIPKTKGIFNVYVPGEAKVFTEPVKDELAKVIAEKEAV